MPEVGPLKSELNGNILNQLQQRTKAVSPVETQAESSDAEGKCFCCLGEGENQHATEYLGTLRKCLNLIVMPTKENALRMCAECVIFVTKVESFREMVRTSQTQLQGAFGIMVPMEDNCDVPETAPDKTETEEVCQELLEESVVPSVDNEVVISKTDNDFSTDDDDDFYDGDKGNIEEQNESSSVKTKQRSKKNLSMSERSLLLMDRQNMRFNIALILYHSTVVPFRFGTTAKCFYCPKFHLTFKELKEHTLTEHSDQTEDTIYALLLKSIREFIVCVDISCIQCKICQEKIDSIENLVEHLQKRHYKTYYKTTTNNSHGVLGFDMSTDTPKCHICQKEFEHFRYLKLHMDDHYGHNVCYVCGKRYMSDQKYISHTKICNKTEEVKCKFCNKLMKTAAKLEYHILNVHIKRVIKCSVCPKTFGRYYDRTDHMIKEHGLPKPVYRCEPCNREYSSAYSLKSHRSHIHSRNSAVTNAVI